MNPPSGVIPTVDAQSGLRMCPHCGRNWGPSASCQSCGQAEGFPDGICLSSAGKRFGAYLLDLVLAVVTLGIGWLIWTLVVWGRGQTPAKQLLDMRVVKLRTGTKATWGTMFVRDFLCKGLLFGVIVSITLIGFVLYFWLLWDKMKQELWDKMVDTIVVDDPGKVMAELR